MRGYQVRHCLQRFRELASLFVVIATFVLANSCFSTLSAHDEVGGGKGIGDSAPAGIGGNGPYASKNIFLHSRLSLPELGSGGASNVLGNDIWGWTDSTTGREYALMGLTNQTAFVDITDSANPVYLGSMATETGNRSWRDIKVHNDHAFVVSDLNGAHGMQVFDLTQLRGVTAPQSFSPNTVYDGFDRAHNIAINEESGFAYVVGSEVASGGLHVLDISNPTNPVHVGDFSDDGYTHDVQVVNYTGPDSMYAGREVAFASNEDTLTIVDVTDKNNITEISRNGYEGSFYTHQGWLSEDHRFFFMNDELDERDDAGVNATITRVWNVEDLENPVLLNAHEGTNFTIDHNNYTHDGFIFQANYTSGLRVLELVDETTGELEEFGFFDTFNTDDNISFNGAWSVFPYFDSGLFVVSDRQNGLFVLSFSPVPEPGSFGVVAAGLFGISLLRRRRRLAA